MVMGCYGDDNPAHGHALNPAHGRPWGWCSTRLAAALSEATLEHVGSAPAPRAWYVVYACPASIPCRPVPTHAESSNQHACYLHYGAAACKPLVAR